MWCVKKKNNNKGSYLGTLVYPQWYGRGERKNYRKETCWTLFSLVIEKCIWTWNFCFLLKFFLNVYFYFWEWETEREWGSGRERGRHRIWSRPQAPSCQHRAQGGAWTHKPWDHDGAEVWRFTNWATQALLEFLFLTYCIQWSWIGNLEYSIGQNP